MLSHVRELFVWQDLLLNWIKREFRVRYSQSILGIAWAILQPLSLMIIMTVVFSVLLRIPTSDVPYPVFVYSGLLPWMFFANSLSAAIPSIADNFNLVSKVYFPREILPFSAIPLPYSHRAICFIAPHSHRDSIHTHFWIKFTGRSSQRVLPGYTLCYSLGAATNHVFVPNLLFH
jgi:hypothetical protein